MQGKGTGGSGVVRRGIIKQGDNVDILGYFNAPLRSKVDSMDSFSKVMTIAEAGESIMMFLRWTNEKNLYRGQTVCATNSLKLCNRFEGEMTVLTPEEGGRDRPFNQRFKSQVTLTLTHSSTLVVGMHLSA
jgi:elongation factor Tu